MKNDADAKSYAEAVAAVIKRRRQAADLSMNRLGEAAGLSQPMIGLIERGIHTPTISTLHRIARALGTTPAVMLAEVELLPAKTADSSRLVKAKGTTPVRKEEGSKCRVLKKRPKPL